MKDFNKLDFCMLVHVLSIFYFNSIVLLEKMRQIILICFLEGQMQSRGRTKGGLMTS